MSTLKGLAAGGLAFFLLGMHALSNSVGELAGSSLRDWLYKLTGSRVSGYAVGNLLGLGIHSGAASVLVVGFVNAGMLTLAQSVPVTLGINVGTTLSMQLVSFKVGKFALLAVALGALLRQVLRSGRHRAAGAAMFGIGLMFFGMDTISSGVLELKDTGHFEALLSMADGRTPSGYAMCLGASILITALFQSSGAAIGMLFALCQAGVFTQIQQVFPFIIGAHIGTCSATLLGAAGTHIEARRAAYSHLAFNVIGAAVATGLLPAYGWLIPHTSADLTRQVANTHTGVQLVNSLIALPMSAGVARLICWLTPSNDKPIEQSYLKQSDLQTPEKAIADALREERRMASITRVMLVQAMTGLLRQSTKPFARVAKSEQAVDTLKRTVNEYLNKIATRQLSVRQSILLQHLTVAASDLERIGDHIETITNTSIQKMRQRIWFDTESMRLLVEQYRQVDRLLRLTILSLDPELRAFKQLSARMLQLRQEFVDRSSVMRTRYRDLIVNRQSTTLNGLYYERYLRCFERIARHTKSIARLEQHDLFNVKPQNFERRTDQAVQARSSDSQAIEIDEAILSEELEFEDLGIDLNRISMPSPSQWTDEPSELPGEVAPAGDDEPESDL